MISEKLNQAVIYICSVHPHVSQAEYAARVHALYGALEQAGSITDGMLREITMVEQALLKEGGNYEGYQRPKAEQLVAEYSRAAFGMARMSLLEQEEFSIALTMKAAFKTMVTSFLPPDEKAVMKNLISETLLDFDFAAGDHRISSLRMAPIIRSSRNE